MLPVHLAVKKHADPETLNMLLAAYPEAIDVCNFHGMTPYKMAETSSSKHKAYYLRALKRGSTHSAITASLADLMCGIQLPSVADLDPRRMFRMASE